MSLCTVGQRVRLDSPYGFLHTPGGGRIDNGATGTVTAVGRGGGLHVRFDEERNTVKVPLHWAAPIEEAAS